MRHVWWKEKLHVLLQWEKTCFCPSGKLFIDNTYHYEFMGLDEIWLLNILHNSINKIADYAFFNLNQLRELDISNNAIVNLPVHVFQGLICLKEVN